MAETHSRYLSILLPLMALTGILCAAPEKDKGAAREIPGTGWTVKPPPGYQEHYDEHHPQSLRWRRDVLLPSPSPVPDEGTQYEHIIVSPQKLPGGLVGSCSQDARSRGLGEPVETEHLGRRMVAYICPGAEWSGSHGDSHSWRCLLDMDGETGVEINFWSTWYEIKDPGRVDRDRTKGLEAFRAMCDSLAPLPAKARPAKAAPPVTGRRRGCEPGGFTAEVETVDPAAGSFTYRRPGQWSRAVFARDVSVLIRGAAAKTDDIWPGDAVRVKRDCLTDLVTEVEILNQLGGKDTQEDAAATAPAAGSPAVPEAAPAGATARTLPMPPGTVVAPAPAQQTGAGAPGQTKEPPVGIMKYKIYFIDSPFRMTPNSVKKLKAVAELLGQYPQARIQLVGLIYSGQATPPLRPAKEMADLAVQELVATHGIKKERLEVTFKNSAIPTSMIEITITIQ